MTLMSIGEFARLTRLSPKALRLYDELGLLPPDRVDPDTGYRWYAAGQLDQARLVAALRGLRMPLAEIGALAGLCREAAAERVARYWAAAEADHAARRELAGFLVASLTGRTTSMYEITVREVPARTLLSQIRHAHAGELPPLVRELLITRMRQAQVPRVPGVAGAPFIIFHGEVSEDSDGPVEICRPVPAGQADELAARFPDLTLRTEAAHQEAYLHLGQERLATERLIPAVESLFAWAGEHQRRPAGGLRQIMMFNPESHENGPDIDYAVPLR